jgi:hypothetical protein
MGTEARNDTLQSVQVREWAAKHHPQEIAAYIGQAECGSDRHLSTQLTVKPRLDLNSVSQFIPDMISNLSAQQLRRAASIKDQIDGLQTELDRLLGSSNGKIAPTGKRTMSASARARIAAAQKARWAKVKGKTEKPAKSAKRKMSAAGRAKIAAAAKARWAKAKAAGKKSL